MANNIIGRTAIACAWPPGTSLSKYKYPHGRRTSAYKKALSKAIKKKKARLSHKRKMGASCDIFPWAIIVSLGIDMKFPSGLSSQKPYLRRSSKWYRVPNSKCRGGDVLVRPDHILIVVEYNGKRRRANAHYKYHGGTYGVIDGKPGYNSRYKTYRIKLKYLDKVGDTGGSSAKKPSKTTETVNSKWEKKDFLHLSEVIIESLEPELEKGHLVSVLLEDWDELKDKFPSISNSIINNIEQLNYISIEMLISYYLDMVLKVQKTLIKANRLINGSKYIYFIDNGFFPNILTYDGINSKDYVYYTCSSNISFSEWLEFYKTLCLKYYALLCYQESRKTYKSITGTSVYLEEIKPQLIQSYNDSLNSLYVLMNDYVNENVDEFDNNETLNEINLSIADLQINIGKINAEINSSYTDRAELKLQLEKNRNLWLNLTDTKINFKIKNFSDTYTYWNKNIIQEPNLLNFWLEFSDSNEMNNYVVLNIGRKAYSVNNELVTSIYYRKIPNVIYYSDFDIDKNKTGYVYLKVNNINTMFKNSALGLSAKNVIDDLLYNHLYCTEELNLQIVPVHYLEPNTRILIYDEKAHINDEYIIEKISDPINYNGIMTINATRVSERLY